MDRFISGSQFGVKVGLRVAIFVALTVGFPFIVYGLIMATNARSVGGASGALAAVAGIFLKPVIVLGFLVSLIGPCWRRMRSLGLPASWALLVPFLFLMDGTYLLVAGTHWGTGFALGIWMVSAPLFAMTGLAILIAMVFASPPSDHVASSPLFRRLEWVCVGLAVMLIVVALLTSGRLYWLQLTMTFSAPADYISRSSMSMKAAYYAHMLKPFICAAFGAAMALMALLSRREVGGNTSGGSERGRGSVSLSPPSTRRNAGGAVFGKR